MSPEICIAKTCPSTPFLNSRTSASVNNTQRCCPNSSKNLPRIFLRKDWIFHILALTALGATLGITSSSRAEPAGISHAMAGLHLHHQKNRAPQASLLRQGGKTEEPNNYATHHQKILAPDAVLAKHWGDTWGDGSADGELFN